MAANSHTSSMSAQNGSSYSSSIYLSDSASQTAYQGNSYPSAASAAQARYPGGQRPVRNHRNHPLENGHGPRSQAQGQGQAQAQAQDPSNGEQPVYEQPSSTYSTHQDYYLSSPGYYPPAEPTTYENELDFDEDQNEGSQSTSVYRRPSYPNDSGARIQPTSVPQNYSTQQAAPAGPAYLPSETTQMWQTQQSPEERLRLGLPRHEPGQQAREYQQAASRYESAHRNRR